MMAQLIDENSPFSREALAEHAKAINRRFEQHRFRCSIRAGIEFGFAPGYESNHSLRN